MYTNYLPSLFSPIIYSLLQTQQLPTSWLPIWLEPINLPKFKPGVLWFQHRLHSSKRGKLHGIDLCDSWLKRPCEKPAEYGWKGLYKLHTSLLSLQSCRPGTSRQTVKWDAWPVIYNSSMQWKFEFSRDLLFSPYAIFSCCSFTSYMNSGERMPANIQSVFRQTAHGLSYCTLVTPLR